MFSHFLIHFLFLKILTKKSPFGQNFSFWAKNAKIFKNKKLIKKVRKHSLDTYILMALAIFLVIFVQKYFFTLVKKNLGQKSLFGDFSKIRFLAKNLTI